MSYSDPRFTAPYSYPLYEPGERVYFVNGIDIVRAMVEYSQASTDGCVVYGLAGWGQPIEECKLFRNWQAAQESLAEAIKIK